MPSPITSADFDLMSWSGDVCEKLRKLLEINDTLKTSYGWMFNPDGTVSSAFLLEIQSVATPVGAIIWRPLDSVPAGYLAANGQAVSRTTYAPLFAVYGTTFGAGDGTTTFNIINLENKMLVGDGATFPLGDSGGEVSHALTIAEMPAHNHSYQRYTPGPPPTDNKVDGTNVDGGYEVQATGSAGSNVPHNNMPPYRSGRWLVKT